MICLAKFLNDCGACIEGAGSDKLVIKGKSWLHGSRYTIAPDRIEAGTFMLAAAITRSCISMSPVIPSHMSCLLDKLKAAGCKIRQWTHDTLEVRFIFFCFFLCPLICFFNEAKLIGRFRFQQSLLMLAKI